VRGKIKKIALVASLIASFLALTFATPAALAPVTPILAAEEIENTALVPGSTVTANITITDVEAMLGYQIWLSWDPTILTITAVSTEFPFTYDWGTFIGDGYLYMVYSFPLPEKDGFYSAEPGVPKTLAIITFTVKGYGFCALDLYNTIVIHISEAPITHIVSDGYFLNVPVERRADLAHRRADAQHPVWYLNKWATNTLTGYVKNIGTVPTKVKVVFSLTDGMTTSLITTNEDTVNPGHVVKVSVTLTPDDMFSGFGYYYWTARAFYDSDGDGTTDMAGTRTKTQHLDFLPIAP